jgi:hypothetical protein
VRRGNRYAAAQEAADLVAAAYRLLPSEAVAVKETIFQFNVQLLAREPSIQYESVKELLAAVNGVLAVSGKRWDSIAELNVQSRFRDADDAKKLHRKLILLLKRTEDLQISGVSSNLTDVFG